MSGNEQGGSLRPSKPIVLITDAEPDDVAAILLLWAKNFTIVRILIIDRKEEDTWPRDKVIRQLCEKTNHTEIPCDYSSDSYELAEKLNEELSKHVQQDVRLNIVCLANFLPLVRFVETNAEFAKMFDVWTYGSVNLRWALKHVDVTTILNTINHGFASFYMFETFGAFGQKASADATTTPDLSNWLSKAQTGAGAFLRKQIAEWNYQIFFDMFMKVIREPELDAFSKSCTLDRFAQMIFGESQIDEGETQLTRAQFLTAIMQIPSDRHKVFIAAKILASILNDIHQMVFADVGLIVAATNSQWAQKFELCTICLDNKHFVTLSPPVSSSTARYFSSGEEKPQTLALFGTSAASVFSLVYP